jgi:hypothetical protein
LVAKTTHVPAEVEVNESPFETTHPAVPELITVYVTAPGPLPPLVNSRRFVRKTAEVDVRVKVDCTALDTVIDTELVESAAW